MTASVSHASALAVTVSHGGARQAARSDHASGFDRLLGAAVRNQGDAGENAPKVKGAAPHGRDHRQGRAAPEAADASQPDARIHDTKPHVKADLATGVEPRFDEADAPQDASAEKHEEDDERGALPTQIKAEQTISALMALTPASHHSPVSEAAKPGGEKPAANAEARQPRSTAVEALTQHSHADQRAIEAVATNASQARVAARIGTFAPRADVDAANAPGAAAAVAAAGETGSVARVAAVDAKPGAAVDARSIETVDTAPTAPGTRKPRPASDGGDAKPVGKGGKPAPTEAARPQPEASKLVPKAATGDSEAGGQPDLAGGKRDTRTSAEPQRSEPAVAGRVSIVGQQSVPAPAPQLGQNASAVVAAIAGEHGLRAAGASPVDSALVPRSAQPMRSLKIEMHPAELGAVTVNLRTSGERMSVELRVENHQAYQRLSADSDAIVQSLRSLGYDIDRVSIQQPQAAAATSAHAETGAAAGGLARDASSFQPGNSGSGSERSAGQSNGQGSRNDGQRHDQSREVGQDRAGDSLYI